MAVGPLSSRLQMPMTRTKSATLILALPPKATAAPRRVGTHLCLAGLKISNDCRLIIRLKAKHKLTLVQQTRSLLAEQEGSPSGGGWLGSLRVLVLDCTKTGCRALTRRDFNGIIRFLRFLRQTHPKLCVILVEGDLDQARIAEAYQEGIRDYFATPYDSELLADRIGHYLK